MRIFTSYFGNLVNLQLKGITPIAICRKKPYWFKGAHIIELAPELKALKWPPSKYVPHYEKILAQLNPHKIQEQIHHLTGGKDAALLCYEKPGQFCHRQLVAEWLTHHGIAIKEYQGE